MLILRQLSPEKVKQNMHCHVVTFFFIIMTISLKVTMIILTLSPWIVMLSSFCHLEQIKVTIWSIVKLVLICFSEESLK